MQTTRNPRPRMLRPKNKIFRATEVAPSSILFVNKQKVAATPHENQHESDEILRIHESLWSFDALPQLHYLHMLLWSIISTLEILIQCILHEHELLWVENILSIFYQIPQYCSINITFGY